MWMDVSLDLHRLLNYDVQSAIPALGNPAALKIQVSFVVECCGQMHLSMVKEENTQKYRVGQSRILFISVPKNIQRKISEHVFRCVWCVKRRHFHIIKVREYL